MDDAQIGETRGRKPLDSSDETVIFSMRMTTAQRRKLDVLGGGPWVRERIDRARVSNEDAAKPRGGSSGAKKRGQLVLQHRPAPDHQSRKR